MATVGHGTNRGNPPMTPTEAQPCDNHTYGPTGYIGWHDWAERKSKTHKQLKCKGCGLYKIWVKK